MGINKILTKIKEYDKIAIYGHIRPDGDCYGSQFGLADIIKESFPEKEVKVVGAVSDYVSFVGTPDIVSDDFTKRALSIVVDTATSSRVSDQRYANGFEIIKIDHHIPVDQYGDLIWVDTNFPACSQMISYFYYKFKDQLKMSPKGAMALYTGIVTDTGRFRYRGVSSQTHQLAGLLIGLGAKADEIDNNLSQTSLEELYLKGEVLSNFVTTKGGFIYYKMTRETIERFKISDEDAANQVNLLAGIKGYPIWALIIEYPGEIRVRLRSSGIVISDIASKYQGGGHAQAAGATLKNWEELESLILDVEAKIKSWENQ